MPLLVMANKQDLLNALSPAEVSINRETRMNRRTSINRQTSISSQRSINRQKMDYDRVLASHGKRERKRESMRARERQRDWGKTYF